MFLFGMQTDTSFYAMFQSQARMAHEAAEVFCHLTADFEHIDSHLDVLEKIEHDGDTLTHAVVNKINSQFVTPLDKEDLHALTDRLDNILDAVESGAAHIGLYCLPKPRPDLQSLVGMLVTITQETQSLVTALQQGFHKERLSAMLAGIHALESHSDKAFRKAVTDLFEDENLDCRLLIKWKDVYERIEHAINECEKLAGFIESLMGKYA